MSELTARQIEADEAAAGNDRSKFPYVVRRDVVAEAAYNAYEFNDQWTWKRLLEDIEAAAPSEIRDTHIDIRDEWLAMADAILAALDASEAP